MKTSQEIATMIKNQASSKNITIKKMLSDCKLSINTLSSMQSGGCYPRLEAITKIADYLDIPLDYLVGRTDKLEVQTNNSNSTITGNNIVNGNVSNSSNVNTATANTTTLDETAEQVLSAFQSMTLADKAKVITLIAELTEKNKTA